MSSLGQDVRFGVRVLRTSPGLTAVAVFTLALGIAANATVFSWVDNFLLHPFPGSSDAATLAILEMITQAPNGGTQLSYVDYGDYRRNLRTIAGLAMHREEVFSLGQGIDAKPVWGELVTGNYFSVLGVKAAIGRVFTEEEDADRLGAFPVAVISDSLWRSRFRSDPGIQGKTIQVNQLNLTVVGVAPPEFRGTQPGLVFHIWVPVTMGAQLGLVNPDMFKSRDHRNMYGIVRLKPGVSVERARDEAAAVARALAAAYPKTNRDAGAAIVPAWRFHGGAPELLLQPLRILMAVAALALILVCLNVSNLLLARSVARHREFGIRMALGSGRIRLVRQLFVETLLLATVGALAALVVAAWMADSLRVLTPSVGITVATGFRVNGWVLGFTALICVTAALAAGIAPALFSARADVAAALKEGGRTGTAGGHTQRMNGALVVAEVAIATVALIGAGLFARSLQNARSIYPGFQKDNVLLGRFYLGGSGRSDRESKAFCENLRRRLQSEAGVADVSYADFAPLGSTAGPWDDLQVEGYVPAAAERMTVNRALISPGYFRTLGIPMLAGRDFTPNEETNKFQVAIVNESFARRYFGGASPLGRKIKCHRAWATVVGLVKDSKYFHVAEAPRPFVYASFEQRYGIESQLYFFIRTKGDPLQAAGALRRDVAAVAPDIGTFYPMPLSEWMEVTMLPQKIAASLLGALGLMSLFLAAIGLYSVMAYAVGQRTQEIGVRIALGALPGDIFRDILGRGLLLTGAGLVVGCAVAFAITRLIDAMLVKVVASDPITFIGASVFLTLTAAAASAVPAWRAMKVDPILALRRE